MQMCEHEGFAHGVDPNLLPCRTGNVKELLEDEDGAPYPPAVQEGRMTPQQCERLLLLCERFNVEFDAEHYLPAFDLPTGWVAGWIGGPLHDGTHFPSKKTIYVGVSPEGDSHS